MKILIVDDSRDDRRLLRYIIEKKGHEAVEAEDGLEGLRMAKIQRPDLIISDALMPVMDGFQFLRHIKDDETLKSIPFIFYSAMYRADKDVDLALALGAEAYIIKPKEPSELWEEVEFILQNREKGKIITPELIKEEDEYLKRYSQVVAAKLEEKVRELENSLALREKAEKEVNFLASVIRNVPEAVCAIEPAGNIIFWNEGAVKMLGYTAEEIIGKPITMTIPEDLALKELDHCIGILNTEGRFRDYETVRLTKDGRILPVEITAVAIKDKTEDITGYTSIMRDITERKKAEERLIEAKEEWERTFDAIEDPIMILDTCHSIIKANKSMADKLGVSPSEAEGMTCYEHVHGTTEPPEFCPHSRLLSDSRSHSEEIYDERLGGYYNVSVSPLYGPEGRLYGSVHIARDITGRKQAEKELREGEERLRSILESVQTGIVMIDPEKHRIVYANPIAVRLIDAPEEKIIGSVCHQFICPAEKGRCPVTDLGQTVDNSDRVLITAGRKEVPIIKTVTPVMIGGRRHLLESFVDITERKLAEVELKQKTEDLDQFFNVTLDLLCIADTAGHFRRLNRAWERILGYSREELMARKFLDFIHPDDVAATLDAVATLASQREVIDFVNRYRCKDGTYRWIEWRSAPSGNLIYAAAHDITEEKQAERELKEKMEELQKFYDMAVGRERRMKELKREIEQLKNELSPYKKES